MRTIPTSLILFAVILLVSCQSPVREPAAATNPINGTWRLFRGITITKGDSVVTDYTKDQTMIKIINDTHFAFLKHDQAPKKDSSNHFDAGGGSYTLTGNQYTEHLDYYIDHNWEAKTFNFTITINNDTLIQKGREKVEGTGIDREIIEKYIRVK